MLAFRLLASNAISHVIHCIVGQTFTSPGFLVPDYTSVIRPGVYTNGTFLYTMNNGVNDTIKVIASTDDGVSWSTRSTISGQIQGGISLNPTTGTMLIGLGESVERSTDHGVTWTNIPLTGFVRTGSSNGNTWIMTGDGGGGFGIARSNDDGLTWELTPEPDPGVSGSIFYLGSTYVGTRLFVAQFVGGSANEGFLFSSDDNGDTWTLRHNLGNFSGGFVFFATVGGIIGMLAQCVSPSQTIIYRSSDNGDTWIDTLTDSFHAYTGITSIDNKFIISSYSPNYATSEDLVNWTDVQVNDFPDMDATTLVWNGASDSTKTIVAAQQGSTDSLVIRSNCSP